MKALYQDWVRADYEDHNIRYCEPMTAHALEDPVDQVAHLNDPNSIVEEKFDGTRGILHFFPFGCRVFSRRISKKTNWFAENSDSLPQMRDLKIPELSGTVIDGEMFIPDRPFKDVSATLNCKWDKAVERQKELGEIVFHAFDILYYRGICVEAMSLKKRKYFLSKVFRTLERHGVKCIEEVPYYQCGSLFSPHKFGEEMTSIQYYEQIVRTGGEGVIIKDLSMPYEHKRSKAFLKIKKFYTRECILLGFSEPTKYYDGKFPDDKWPYWESPDGIPTSDFSSSVSAKKYLSGGYKPLTKYYVNKWVGNMIFGVIVTPDDLETLSKDKIYETKTITIDGRDYTVLVVGECSGFDEDVRASLSYKDIGRRVIEVKCNEIFKDTGKMRHPRFLRFREDKDVLDCTYRNHIEE